MTTNKNFKIAALMGAAVGCTILSSVAGTAAVAVGSVNKPAGLALKATSWALSGASAIAASVALTPIVDMVDEKLSGVAGGYGVAI